MQTISVSPTSPFEDNIGPADSLSVVEESLGLTLAPKPSTQEEIGGSTATVEGSAGPSSLESSVGPTISKDSISPSFSLLPKRAGVEAEVAPLPSPVRLPFPTTLSPTADDGFDNLRVVDSRANERMCSDTIGLVPRERSDELVVAFRYEVEYNFTDIHDYIDDLESLILDFVAKSVLRCSRGNDPDAVQLRKLEEGTTKNIGVIGVRYPANGQITSTCTSK